MIPMIPDYRARAGLPPFRLSLPSPARLALRGLSWAGSRIDLYIARRILVPLIGTIIVTVTLLVLQYLPILFERTVQGGGGTWVVWKMLGYLVPEYLDLGMPISLLLGTLLAFRGLALEQEFDALAACGIGPAQLLRVPLMYAVVMSGLIVAMTGFVQPLSLYQYDNLGFQAKVGAFGIPLHVGEFNQLTDKIMLRLNGFDDVRGKMDGIFIRVAGNKADEAVFSARTGEFVKSPESDRMILRLHHGQIVRVGTAFAGTSALDFDRYDLTIQMPAIQGFRARGEREVEMTLPELFAARADMSRPARLRRLADGEAQRRIILALLPFALPFLALALAKPPQRTSSALGVVVGVVLIVLMLKSLDIGVRATAFPAAPMLWGAFAAFCALTARLFYIHACMPGRHPLDLLHRLSEGFLDKMRVTGGAKS
jgi:lipopolysaccharide export system permease protein